MFVTVYIITCRNVKELCVSQRSALQQTAAVYLNSLKNLLLVMKRQCVKLDSPAAKPLCRPGFTSCVPRSLFR